MKKRTKGIVMFAFLGGLMATSGVVIAIPPPAQQDPLMARTLTGTPADNFPDAHRERFCSSGPPGSTPYITEHRLPTDCAQPLAVSVGPGGRVWFAQTNGGGLGSFDPASGEFEEFGNPLWPGHPELPAGSRSMVWGMDHGPGGELWFTDEAHDSIWRFSGGEYERLAYPAPGGDSFPQRVRADGGGAIVNDLVGNRITVVGPPGEGGSEYTSVPSPVEGAVTAAFAVDGGVIWYTNWAQAGGGVLVRFDRAAHEASGGGGPGEHAEAFPLPPGLSTPNGIAVGPSGGVWVADTSGSSLYRFDPEGPSFSEYPLSPPPPSAYGNATGVIGSPLSRPYWVEADGGRLVFNEHAANRIGVLEPAEGLLVEYDVPSSNPAWGDCALLRGCGLAQVFGFDVSGDEVWFTEWVENNLAVLDLSVPVPFSVALDAASVSVRPGGEARVGVSSPGAAGLPRAALVHASPGPHLSVELEGAPGGEASAVVRASPDAEPGSYAVLLGVRTDYVSVSRYLEVEVG